MTAIHLFDIIFSDIFQIIQFLNLFIIVGVVFFERRNPSKAMVWILALVFLPFLGFVLYLIFGQSIRKEKKFKMKAEVDAKLQEYFTRQIHMLSNPETIPNSLVRRFRDMILMESRNPGSFLHGHNDVKVYTDGHEKFADLIEAITGATDHIHLEYYIIRDDELGRKVVTALTEKAQEGLEVKLLCDGLGCQKLGKGFFREFKEAGGEVAFFFPSIIPYVNTRINYRNHRKIAVIDGTCGFVGGYNIGTEYLGEGPLGYWRDAAIRIVGDGVISLQIRFLMDWDFATDETYTPQKRHFPEREDYSDVATCTTYLQIVSSGPDSQWERIKKGYFKMISEAKESIYIQTPYFVPDESILEALKVAALSGIDVRLMIPCKPDHPFVYWVSYSYAGELIEAGARIFTYDRGFIHAKTVVIDGLVASVGSANWDLRSFVTNFETNAFVYDHDIGKKFQDEFLADLDYCTEITNEVYADRSLLIKIKEGISRLFAPLA